MVTEENATLQHDNTFQPLDIKYLNDYLKTSDKIAFCNTPYGMCINAPAVAAQTAQEERRGRLSPYGKTTAIGTVAMGAMGLAAYYLKNKGGSKTKRNRKKLSKNKNRKTKRVKTKKRRTKK